MRPPDLHLTHARKAHAWLSALAALILASSLVGGPAWAEGTRPPALQVPKCSPSMETRTTGCETFKGAAFVTLRGASVGYVQFVGTMTWRMSTTSRDFTAEVDAMPVAVVDEAAGAVVGITPVCNGTCSSTGSVVGVAVPGVPLRGTLHFTDTTRTQHDVKAHLVLTPVKRGLIGMPGIAVAKTKIRCDDMFNGQRPGCVNLDYIPTITSLSRLRFVSAGIRALQSKGARRLLHRNTYLTDTNRYAICGKAKLPPRWKPPAGWPKPLSNRLNKPSCDEYAFATTFEGGKAPGNGYTWVPQRENSSQGGLLKGFYYENRVLDAPSIVQPGDAFYVRP
ncbi:NucA/NucB deoxyribonuclease domain-containing protein [Actinomadura rupiterrae]|uniref:NucA/NucB deoxyribonuclease domain-containing protein n=1 Tax=Actinomadura rupiterrae TaxID=559627 RepID=UPI0020A60C92|nr:NucA/NucB deoxyribonuclease domain-containing protein [Actinomadura rupiterrae]MCP2342550.1 hypothetical protein [Actinomadura rupiterrae]